MMAQYLGIKAEYDAYLLFYRMGDFYELFFEDAVDAAAALDITLTKRGQHGGADIPMCGVPVHSADSYLARLIRAGFRVAICEQTEDPAEAKKRGAKAVVRREVVRVVTPGTLSEDTLLSARQSNILVAAAELRGEIGLAWVDMSIGDVQVLTSTADRFSSDIARLDAAEVITLSAEMAEQLAPIATNTTSRAHRALSSSQAEKLLHKAYGVSTLAGFGSLDRPIVLALGVLIDYLQDTQKGAMPPLSPPRQVSATAHMRIDPATRRSLELTQTQMGERAGSLLDCIDHSLTGAGARLLADWFAAPSCSVQTIIERQDMVAWFVDQSALRDDVRRVLKTCPDMQRALGRLSLGRGGPRDMLAIAAALQAASDVRSLLDNAQAQLLANLPNLLPTIAQPLQGHGALSDLLADALLEEAPLSARDGNFINSDFDAALAEHRSLKTEGRRHILSLEAEYKELTAVTALKIKHNNVLGYHVDLPARYADPLMTAPLNDTFIHRQTLANAVRFSTEALADLAGRITRAADEALAREMALFEELRTKILLQTQALMDCSQALATLDVLAALADLAVAQHYVRPKVDDSMTFEVKGGRHPVVEAALGEEHKVFVANDCSLAESHRLWLLTGPNMAGKSTFLRQNALIVLMAQTGSFVPAEAAHIGIVDQLFSRVGASDDLARGRSTFMVEMVETAAILNQATPSSFVILDEIGRGTSTYDGLSIAWATAEHLATQSKSRALFATHYHELTALTQQYDSIAAYSIKAREWDGDLIFLHEVVPGAADRSYGVQVAKLAGMPGSVVARARDILALLEDKASAGHSGAAPILDDLPLFTQQPMKAEAPGPSDLEAALAKLDPDALTPRAALDALYELKSLSSSD